MVVLVLLQPLVGVAMILQELVLKFLQVHSTACDTYYRVGSYPMKFFGQLGATLERSWREKNYDEAIFPVLAQQA